MAFTDIPSPGWTFAVEKGAESWDETRAAGEGTEDEGAGQSGG